MCVHVNCGKVHDQVLEVSNHFNIVCDIFSRCQVHMSLVMIVYTVSFASLDVQQQ